MKRFYRYALTVCVLFCAIQLAAIGQRINIPEPVRPPQDVCDTFGLDSSFYEQWIDVEGLPVVASASVSPYALKEAAYLILQMTEHRSELIEALVENRVRLAVVAHTEMITDIPEYSYYRPAYYHNLRGRVIGGKKPIINEENLLNYPGNPYNGSVSMFHEFGHALEDPAMKEIEFGFRARIERVYQTAVKNGSWKGTYTSTNAGEYWAEGTEAWFHPNGRVNADRYGNTREALKKYDPGLAALLTEVYGDSDWRYTLPEMRLHQPHLQGFDPQNTPRFQYPPAAVALYEKLIRDPESTGDGRWVNLKPYPPSQLPKLQASRSRGTETEILFGNFRGNSNTLLVSWVAPDGSEGRKLRLRGDMRSYHTYAGELWLVKDKNGKKLAVYRAEEKTGRVLYISENERYTPIDNTEAVDNSSIGPGPGPKIEGPWLWMIASTEGKSGPDAASSTKDWLAAASGGTVTEKQIATHGAIVGDMVGNKVWTPGKIAPTGGNNITDLVKAIRLGTGEINNHVAYGSIVLDVPRAQETTMYIGSDDSIKVWLNGVLVYTNPADRGAKDYQNNFPVTLKQGQNILLGAVYQGAGWWSGFFGFENDVKYKIAPIVPIKPADRPPMYWIATKTGTLQRLVGNWIESIAPNVQGATSLAVDAVNGKLYWTTQTSQTHGALNSANLDGTGVKKLVTLDAVPIAVEVDGVGKRLYWIDTRNRLQTSDLNGKNIKAVIDNLKAPKHLALDVAGGKVYWSETAGRIQRANLNGKTIENVATNLGTPLSLDVGGGKVFWTDRDAANVDRLRRADLKAEKISSPKTLAFVLLGSVAIDVGEGKLYLTDWDNGKITRRNFDGNDDEPVVTGLMCPGAIVLGTPPATVTTQPIPPINTTEAINTTDTVPIYSQYDVNKDGKVNDIDSCLVVVAFGESGASIKNARTDINGDDKVDIADVVLVLDNLDEDAAAPGTNVALMALDVDKIQAQIDLLLASRNTSFAAQRTLAYLQYLLAVARPDKTVLFANYPNPFNPETWIPYQLATSGDVRITIYDARGMVVRVLTFGHQPAGYWISRNRAAYWDGRNALGERVASGIYFYQLHTDEVSLMRKMVILK